MSRHSLQVVGRPGEVTQFISPFHKSQRDTLYSYMHKRQMNKFLLLCSLLISRDAASGCGRAVPARWPFCMLTSLPGSWDPVKQGSVILTDLPAHIKASTISKRKEGHVSLVNGRSLSEPQGK